MSSTELFRKHFGDQSASVDLKHPNMEKFFSELNEECLSAAVWSTKDEAMTVSPNGQQTDVSSSGKCSRCKVNDAAEDHTCPYAEEINDDRESLCDCCADCEHECCMDI